MGRNGNGKTNLLEAIYVLSQGKSFRTASTNELVAIGDTNRESSVFGVIESRGEESELGIVFRNKEKEGYINQEKCKSRDQYIGLFKTVLFSPETLSLVQGGPVERRKFIDKHSVDIDQKNLKEIVVFQKIYKTKNSLLKEGRASLAELESINILFAEASVKLREIRERFLQLLKPVAKQIHGEFAEYDGELELSLQDSFEGLTKDEAFSKLMQNIEKERENQICSLGAQRAELIIKLGGKDARSYASQGQTRSIAVTLMLSVIRIIEEAAEEQVVLLLDDIDSELDSVRRERLFNEIFSTKRQVFITGTEARVSGEDAGKFSLFEVQSGSIKNLQFQ